MNALLPTRFHPAGRFDFRRDDVEVVRKGNGSPTKQRRSVLRWFKATVRTIDARQDDLERTHWKKVWRSMVED